MLRFYYTRFLATIALQLTDKKHILFSLVCSLLGTALVVLLIYLYPRHAPIVVINAKSELLRYVVAREELAKVPLKSVDIRGKDVGSCIADYTDQSTFSGLMSPSVGTIVTYRHTGSILALEFLPSETMQSGSVAKLHFNNGRSCSLNERIVVNIDISEEPSGINSRPLPIVGPTEIGKELSTPTVSESEQAAFGLLLEANLKIFGRAAFPFANEALYPAQNAEFVIPAGSRLTSITDTEDADDGKSSWYGIASVGSNNFEISATTEANSLRLYRPGTSKKAESFQPSLFSQLINDPSVAIPSIFLVAFSIIFQIMMTIRRTDEEQLQSQESVDNDVKNNSSRDALIDTVTTEAKVISGKNDIE